MRQPAQDPEDGHGPDSCKMTTYLNFWSTTLVVVVVAVAVAFAVAVAIAVAVITAVAVAVVLVIAVVSFCLVACLF